MILNLRQAIVERVKDKSAEELTDIIEGSIDGDEKALPGLGVLLEIIWKNSEQGVHDQMVSALEQHLHSTAPNR
ncbi:MAG TPA: small acid-soluble spore protein SspI [Bacilli bacterium]